MEERILRVAVEARRLGREMGWQSQGRNRGIEPGTEEESGRIAVGTGGRADHPMHGGFQISVRGQFEQFADIDDESAGTRCRLDPSAIGGLHLQAAKAVLENERKQAAILMGADALFSLLGRAARVADEFEQLMWRPVIDRGEGIGALVQRQGEGAQQPHQYRRDALLPVQHDGFEIRQRCRPLVRTLETQIGRHALPRWHGDVLGADIDLLPPVRPAAGEFEAGAVIATEMRRVDHLDGQLLLLRQCEQRPRLIQNRRVQFGRHAMAGDVEKTHRAGRRAQIGQEPPAPGVIRVKQ